MRFLSRLWPIRPFFSFPIVWWLSWYFTRHIPNLQWGNLITTVLIMGIIGGLVNFFITHDFARRRTDPRRRHPWVITSFGVLAGALGSLSVFLFIFVF